MSRNTYSLLLFQFFIIMIIDGPRLCSAGDGTSVSLVSAAVAVPDVTPTTRVSDDLAEMKTALARLGGLFEKAADKMVLPTPAQKETKTLHPGQASRTQTTTVVMVLTGSRNYRIYKEPELTFPESFKWCQDRGMLLLTLETQAANEALNEALLGKEAGDTYWSSGVGAAAASFTWKTSGNFLTFTKFAGGEPNLPDYLERCLAVGRDKGEIAWFDFKCSDKKKFICEKV